MSKEEIETGSLEENILSRHRSELKQMQVKILQLKKSVNKDKKRKKEIQDEIACLQKNLQDKHFAELAELEKNSLSKQIEISPDEIGSLHISNYDEKHKINSEENGHLSEEEEMGIKGDKKITRAEKRRQKKAQASKEREALIKEAEKMNKFCARNVEVDKIKKILKGKRLKMHEINPDGNCLYAAISHQLGQGSSVAELRLKAANFLRVNQADFLPFITDPTSGDLLTEEQFEEYCKQLESTPTWGGQPELRALSQVLRKRIEVLQAEGSPIVFGEEFSQESALTLAYYRHYYGLGEHYNSVSLINGEEEQQQQE